VSIGTLPANVVTDGAKLASKTWTVDFTKSADTSYNTYVWDASAVLHHTFTIVDPITDPLWDSAKNMCRMPDTGAGIKSEHILWAGILIFSGLVLTTAVRRRTA
jgi:LPXTG-motif cell wall-anchored protein